MFSGALVAVTVSPVYAQLPLDWSSLPTTITNVSDPYTCYAAMTRTWVSDSSQLTLRDTFHVSALRSLSQHTPSSVSAIAKHCTKTIRVDAVPVAQFVHWTWLLLNAGREKDAESIFTRALANPAEATKDMEDGDADGISTESKTVRQRELIHLNAIEQYLKVKPARLSAAVKHAEAINALGSNIKWMRRMDVAFNLYQAALTQGDSTLAQKQAKAVLDIASSAEAQKEKNTAVFLQRRGMLIQARVFLNRKAMLDSLRKSTEAYAEYYQSMLRDLDLRDPKIATTFAPVESEFRFPESAVLPKPNGVSLMLVVGGSSPWSPASAFAVTRRLAKRFPALTIGCVTFTRGYMGQLVMEPAEEAESWRKWAQDFYNAPVSVFVEKTPFWRLPSPDHRRINQYSQVITEYGGRFVLVDQEGKIVHVAALSHAAEPTLTDLITVLLSR
jgi:tetratricopeptide (TPR) repeat protein